VVVQYKKEYKKKSDNPVKGKEVNSSSWFQFYI